MLRVKKGRVRAAQVEQHAVVAGDGNHAHLLNDGGAHLRIIPGGKLGTLSKMRAAPGDRRDWHGFRRLCGTRCQPRLSPGSRPHRPPIFIPSLRRSQNVEALD